MNFKNQENMFANWEIGRSKSKPEGLKAIEVERWLLILEAKDFRQVL